MKKKILIFEDDLATAELAGIVAEQLGFEVAYRIRTDSVLSDVAAESPHIILMDNWIPGDGGFDSIQLLKNTPTTADIPIIFYSANTDFAGLAQTSMADAYITKPFDITDLEGIIKRLIPDSNM
ncbi:response regulator [Sphingobacterium paludis]|uniref:Response regulator receiver domain-containing protein n=1 Tax=Sphingobacterium paludis TaxID=1476465 RepID=A0A4R7CSM4_9SPHI|nr:response regulator [Sphingobacterium paludis]TDS06783.1 response regulator receiver domain-containing protein [Sphingobacterium paludis]